MVAFSKCPVCFERLPAYFRKQLTGDLIHYRHGPCPNCGTELTRDDWSGSLLQISGLLFMGFLILGLWLSPVISSNMMGYCLLAVFLLLCASLVLGTFAKYRLYNDVLNRYQIGLCPHCGSNFMLKARLKPLHYLFFSVNTCPDCSAGIIIDKQYRHLLLTKTVLIFGLMLGGGMLSERHFLLSLALSFIGITLWLTWDARSPRMFTEVESTHANSI